MEFSELSRKVNLYNRPTIIFELIIIMFSFTFKMRRATNYKKNRRSAQVSVLIFVKIKLTEFLFSGFLQACFDRIYKSNWNNLITLSSIN